MNSVNITVAFRRRRLCVASILTACLAIFVSRPLLAGARRWTVKPILLVFLFSLLTCTIVWGQSTAQVSGTVRDQSGAVLPGVQVTATQTATGRSQWRTFFISSILCSLEVRHRGVRVTPTATDRSQWPTSFISSTISSPEGRRRYSSMRRAGDWRFFFPHAAHSLRSRISAPGGHCLTGGRRFQVSSSA